MRLETAGRIDAGLEQFGLIVPAEEEDQEGGWAQHQPVIPDIRGKSAYWIASRDKIPRGCRYGGSRRVAAPATKHRSN